MIHALEIIFVFISTCASFQFHGQHCLNHIIAFKLYFLQLEKIIGKLKTEKYGSRILEEINKHPDTEQTDEAGSKEEPENEVRARKRLKTKKAPIVIESSSDDED